MTIFQIPKMLLARCVIGLTSYTRARWVNPHDRMGSFVAAGFVFSILHTVVLAFLLAILLAAIRGVWGFPMEHAAPLVFLLFILAMPTLFVTNVMDARSYFPLNVWIERRICRKWNVEKRHDLDNDFFRAAQILTNTPIDARMQAKRLELAREAVMTQFLLWALDPEVNRAWQARLMQTSSKRPTYTAPKSRL